jgi:uncharacterized protein YndB with AHSA1/START domain
MTTTEKTRITVEATINAPVEKVWKLWTEPKHITQWNNASEDWHTPKAENDLRVGGKFLSRMEAKDGSAGFDFEGVYEEVKTHERVVYSMSDGRRVDIQFKEEENTTTVTETFDAETTHSIEMQKEGWQSILNNFKEYVERNKDLETIHTEIRIQADIEKVYHTMLAEKPYAEWTTIFSPGSHFIGSWETGSKILFLGPDENGKMGGMVSRIKENIPLQRVSIEHLGMVDNGKEIMSGPEVEAWAGAMEIYTFREENGATVLSVALDTAKDHKAYFLETWPKALEKLKEICEF